MGTVHHHLDTVTQAVGTAASSPPLTGATYVFSFGAVAGSVANIDPLALAGIALAASTFVANQAWAFVRNRREQKQAELQMEIDRLQLEELQQRRSHPAIAAGRGQNP